MKNLLPKNPLAAAGVGVVIGAGIAGVKAWSLYKEGDVSKKEAVSGMVKQGLLFGGIAAASTLAGGQGGGGVGLAAMSVIGLSGGKGMGGGGGGMLPGMISQAFDLGGGGGGGGGRKGGGGSGGGRKGAVGSGGGGKGGVGSGGSSATSSGLLDIISDAVAGVFVSDEGSEPETDVSVKTKTARSRRKGKPTGKKRAALPDEAIFEDLRIDEIDEIDEVEGGEPPADDEPKAS